MNEKNIKNNFRKQRNSESVQREDPVVLKALSETFIHYLEKPSTKFPKARFICRICPYHMDDVSRALKHSTDNIHVKNIKGISITNLMKYLPNPTSNQLDAIDYCLNETLTQNIFISEEEEIRRKSICKEMNVVAVENNGELTICGSLETGLSLAYFSDVNLYLEINPKSNSKISYLSLLQVLSTKFSEKLNLKTDIKLDKNNCGLFCEDSQGVLYHVSNSTHMYQLTSELLKVYRKIDDRAEKLMKLFRYFAKEGFIDRARDGFFSPQIFSILVVFYLQQLSVPILPNLHKLAECNSNLPEKCVKSITIKDSVVRYVSDIDTIKSLWTPPHNKSSLAELWVGLIRFYAVEFDTNNYMVSIRCNEPLLKQDRNIVNKRLAIDDPFDYKRNLLFSWNSMDVVDFVKDQLQGCYIYFAIPQLSSGPAFTKVNFSEITKESLMTTCLVTPTFKKDDFATSIDLMECEFTKVYDEHRLFYDTSKWPVRLFIKICLVKILTSIFDSSHEIDCFIWLLEFRNSSSYFSICNYENFKEHAMNLAMCIFQDFSIYFEATGSWNQADINSRDALDVIKKAVQKFITKSLNITINDDDNDDEIYEAHEMEVNEVEIEDTMEDLVDIEEGNDELDCSKQTVQEVDKSKIITKSYNSECWKLPISFKTTRIIMKGNLESSNEADVYNEHRVQSIPRNQLEYKFNKMFTHKEKLEIVCSFCGGKGHRKECCNDAIPRFSDMKDILKSINPEWFPKLNHVLIKKYESTLPSKERREANQRIFSDIYKIIQNLFPSARPQMFGSSHNGFMTRASDIDICLEFFVDEKRQHLSSKEITNRLRSIGRELKKNVPGIDISYVLNAKVPIIKFFLKDNIQGDISINNSLAIQNTSMLKFYADLCQNMRCLGNLLKFVAKSCDIGDASQGTLSSYAYIVLLVHFLQKRGLLPVLQELHEGDTQPAHVIDGWNAWYQSNTDLIYKLWNPVESPPSLEYLWLDFFYYYIVEFDIDKEVVSIKQSTPLYKIDKGWQMSYMAIEDPFDLNHNLSGSLSLDKCRYILQCFCHVLKFHSNDDNLSRKENTYHMLMEPANLRPPVVTGRTCFLCNKQGHVSRDCTEKIVHKRATTKNGHLPNLTPPLQYKESAITNSFFIQTNLSDMDYTNIPIPMKNLSNSPNDFSVVPISLTFDEKTIIIPMLVGKNEKVSSKINKMIVNNLQSVFPLSAEMMNCTIKPSEIMQPVNTVANNNKPVNIAPSNTVNNVPNSSAINKLPKSSNIKNQTNFQQKNTVTQEFFNQMNRFGPQANQNFAHNPVRMMSTNSNFNPNNIGNMQHLNYNNNPVFQYNQVRPPPGQYQYPNQNQNQRYYNDYNDFVSPNRPGPTHSNVTQRHPHMEAPNKTKHSRGNGPNNR